MNSNIFVLEILNFLKENSDLNSFEIYDTKSKNNHFVYSISITSKNRKINGFGTSTNKDEACFKAVMELLERYIFFNIRPESFKNYSFFGFFKNGITKEFQNINNCYENFLKTSSGLAVHSSFKCASDNAIAELIERHTILKALVTKTPPAHIDHELNAKDSEIDLFCWQGPLEHFVVVARETLEGTTCYGLGCSLSVDIAVIKAKSELASRSHLLQIKELEFLLINDENFRFHLISPIETKHFLESGTSKIIPKFDTHISKSDIWISKIKLPKELSKIGVAAVKAISPKMQPLFKGNWDLNKINPKAIDLNIKFPLDWHFIG